MLKTQLSAEKSLELLKLSPKQFEKKLAVMEKEMIHAAKNLEFEKAAKIRDEMVQMKKKFLGS